MPPTLWTPIQRNAELAPRDVPEQVGDQRMDAYINDAAIALPRSATADGTPWRGNIVIPVNVNGNHWVTVYARDNPIDRSRPQIFIMDSFDSERNRHTITRALNRWFASLAMRAYFGVPNGVVNPQYNNLRSNIQGNVWDCGLYALENAIHLDRGNSNAPIVEASARRTAIGATLL